MVCSNRLSRYWLRGAPVSDAVKELAISLDVGFSAERFSAAISSLNAITHKAVSAR